MSKFQIILTSVFVFAILAGVAMFATYRGGNKTVIGNVTIWGTIDDVVIDEMIFQLRSTDDSFKNVTYKKIKPESFDAEMIEALASNTAPDIFIIPQDSLLKYENKILAIPYDSFSVRDFKDKFIEEGELFLGNEGVLGVPLIIDPLVMYWNRDIFSQAGLVNPPKKWEEFFALAQNITKKDDNLNILKSAVSFGEFRNVTHAKEIISALILQAGSPITRRNGAYIESALLESQTSARLPAESAVNFFTQFSNPVKPVYSWNRALPESKKSFISGDLAVYFGFASELSDIRMKNPNLNFDVAALPKIDDGINVTFGNMYAMSITKSANNPSGAFNVMQSLVSDESLSVMADLINLPPVSRSLLSTKPNNPYMEIFYNSAISSRGWLDPNRDETDIIFKNMIESIVSGREKTSNAVQSADSEISVLLGK